MEELTKLGDRLRKIGISVTFSANYPWIYLDTVNGKRVVEKFRGNHGFTIGFLPATVDRPFHFTDLKEIFKIIRKYNEQ